MSRSIRMSSRRRSACRSSRSTATPLHSDRASSYHVQPWARGSRALPRAPPSTSTFRRVIPAEMRKDSTTRRTTTRGLQRWRHLVEIAMSYLCEVLDAAANVYRLMSAPRLRDRASQIIEASGHSSLSAAVRVTEAQRTVLGVPTAMRRPAGKTTGHNNPRCPACDQVMTIRTNRITKDEFWGCPSYPQCQGSRRKVADTQSQFEKIEINRQRCPHADRDRTSTIKYYGNAHGSFSKCQKCQRRWRRRSAGRSTTRRRQPESTSRPPHRPSRHRQSPLHVRRPPHSRGQPTPGREPLPQRAVRATRELLQ